MIQCRLLVLLVCHLAGVSSFIIGFLLTRTVVPDYSPSCRSTEKARVDQPQCIPTSNLRFKRVVWILIDALRYDFVVYDDSLDPSPPAFRNKMVHVNRYLNTRPEHIRLYPFTADPPTTTMQRLKALTTGSLPTFIDIGSNFNSQEVREDNIVLQCKRNGRRVTFMGDDTWVGLYPRLIDKLFPYPSLNVKDLHTVDNGVIEHLLPELKKQDADFVIAHLLGVDHCGHTYGPSHSSMKEKLRDMDVFLSDVFSAITNDTILFVFGDHGMTATGDHGGETPLETDSALLVYSPVPLFDPKKEHGEQVYQTDIVPTVAQLLGVPIPFSSLGMIIPDLFTPWVGNSSHSSSPGGSLNGLSPREAAMLHFLHSLYLNMGQMYLYLNALVKYDHSFSSPAVDSLVEVYYSANKRYNDIKEAKGFNETMINSVADEMKYFIRGVRSVCVEKWAKFNDTYIYMGILLLMIHLMLVCVMLLLQYKPTSSPLSITGLTESLKYIRYHSFDWISCMSLFLLLFHSFSLFSNSFVVFEQSVVTFSSQTLIILLAIGALKQLVIRKGTYRLEELLRECCKVLWPYCGVMVCVRFSAVFHSCRDQQDDCTVVGFLQPYSKYADSAGLAFKVTAIGVSVFMYRAAVTHCEWTFAKYFSCKRYQTVYSYLSCAWTRESICVVLVILLFEDMFKMVSVVAAWVVYITFLVGLIGVVWKPWWLAHKYMKRLCHGDNGNESSFAQTGDIVHCLVPVSWLVMIILAPLALVVAVPNDSYISALGLMVLQLSFTIVIIQESPQVSLVTRAVLCSLFVDQYFFGLGHQATVNSLRFEAGFVGVYGDISSVNLLIAGVLVGINTLASQVMGPVVLPLLLPHKVTQYVEKGSNPMLSSLLKIQLMYIGIGSLRMVCTVVCASVLRRHLMLWAVFGPRFMYEAAFQSLSIVLTILVNFFVQRVSKQFEKFKQNSLEKSC